MHIFISYAKRDTRDLALQLNAELNALPGVSAWVDAKLKPGRGWAREIEKQIRRCDWMIVLISPDVNREVTETQNESFVLNEIEFALAAKKSILPVLAQDTTVPVELSTAQYIDYTRPGLGIAWLVTQICVGIDLIIAPPDPVPDVRYAPHLQTQIDQIEAERQRRKEQEASERAQHQREAAAAREYAAVQRLASYDPSEAWEALRIFRTTHLSYGDPDDLLLRLAPIELPPPFEWITIPAGEVILEDASHQHNKVPGSRGGKRSVPCFKMAKYPLANAQYDRFVYDPQGYSNPIWWNYSPEAAAWRAAHLRPPDTTFSGKHLPRINVSWYDAVAFCRWLTARLNGVDDPLPDVPPRQWGDDVGMKMRVTLPTEAQWQHTAQRGGRKYPWGNEKPDEDRCNFGGKVGHSTPVTWYTSGASLDGVMDLGGNVREWCLDEWGTEDVNLPGDGERALRGASWRDDERHTRAAYRLGDVPSCCCTMVGFRCCLSIED